jgi:calcineurin-like phosphoesterase
MQYVKNGDGEIKAVIDRFRTKIGARLIVSGGRIEAQGALFDIDTSTKKVRSVTRVRF